ncbi:MAG: alpha/beta hydrolase fold domain-containing protein [Candidatus Sumerlaeota bacterium]|nr:alpha/beta hydrolase fold domain-containing protein [Candidatus Sumerlaeota bacterium]
MKPARIAIPALLLASFMIGCGSARPKNSQISFYSVRIESGVRQTASGDSVAFDIFIPKPAPELPKPPFPAVVLTHGFARDKRYHRNNAQYMAERGIVVMTPNMTSLLGGAAARRRNVLNTRDHIAWLAARAANSGDALNGLIDPSRIGLAGHSAGGAISFGAAVESQTTTAPVAALCLLDAVPFDEAIARAADLKPLPFASLRSEPGPFNAFARILKLYPHLSVPVDDIKIAGATHIDPENPTDLGARLACGGSSEKCQALYQRLMYLFFRDALKGPRLEGDTESFPAALAALQDQKQIQCIRIGSHERNPQ